jgi:Flp pilus assembly protein TadG
LALILPVLLVLVLGCIDLGRFAYEYIAVTNAARAGAGYGSVNPFTTGTYGIWQSNVTQAVVNEMSQDPGFQAGSLSVAATGVSDSNGWRVQVQASYPFQTLIAWPGLPQNLTLTGTAVMRGIR